mgnify:CR=1 FL=1
MTRVEFFRTAQGYTGFFACGHAGDAPEGENIVCAALSASIELTECQLTDVLLLPTQVDIDAKSASVSVRLKHAHPQAQAPLEALWVYLTRLAEEYPRFLKISEVSPC